LHGKELSYNNLVDGEAAVEAAKELAGTNGAVVIKHTNPCGFATGATMADAMEAAWSGDIVSAFGSVIAVTGKVDIKAAQVLKGRFVEILIAPEFSDDALEFLKNKSKDLRILKIPQLDGGEIEPVMHRPLIGGVLQQDRDLILTKEWKSVTKTVFPGTKKELAEFTCKACKHTKSNAIVLGYEYSPGFYMVLGMGAGQPNRVDSLRKLSVTKAMENIQRMHKDCNSAKELKDFENQVLSEAVLASDAFFPFDDTVKHAGEYNIRYIVQPGGSKRDNEVIDTCDSLGISMVFTGARHFRH
ncbi:MAG: bifunctional phosphoribosylaminoimidazolecarboxamide formyltransferase/IMP cyclohydrolase PurH, partial [bacterium]